MKKTLSLFLLLLTLQTAKAEDGYRLWLRYDLIENTQTRNEYREFIKALLIDGNSPTLSIAKKELLTGLSGLLGSVTPLSKNAADKGLIVCGTFDSGTIKGLKLNVDKTAIGREGFVIKSVSINKRNVIAI